MLIKFGQIILEYLTLIRSSNLSNAGILTNSATLITQSGVASNSALVSVFGTLYVGSNCTIYPYSYPTNSSAPLFTMRDLLVATGGTINADAKGYASNLGTGHGISGSGAGYGGQGGQELYSVNHWAGGITYGSSNAPVDPGSGGGKMLYDVYGGGLVTVQASGNVRIDGTITANGQSDLVDRSGGGSGGGIYIKCWKFYGGGSLSANGGSTVNYSGGGGGGGRIAVWMQAPLHTVSNTVNGGIGYDSTGQVGTVVFGLLPPPGTIWTVQ